MSSVGEILKNTREAKGITIEQVAEATSIRVLYLEAIENEKFNLVPGEVYLKGFIRNYANYIGLNGPAMVEKYKEQVAEASKKHEHVVQTDADDSKYQQAKQFRRSENKLTKSKVCTVKSLIEKFLTKNNIVILIVIIVVLAIGTFLSSLLNSDKGREEVKLKQDAVESVQGKSDGKSKVASVFKNQSGIYIVKDASNIETKVEFSGDCWTEAYADGKEVFVGMMTAGKTIEWSAEKNLQVKLGNVRAAKIYCNGQAIPYESDENGVALRTFKR
ncbi:MAG: helix-turn-helix domain-containing protein [Acidaminococcaceae bacterium]